MTSANDSADMTIDQIAQHANIPVSTVRMYQNKGLLPAPERRGRVGFYGDQHRDRLAMIATLQGRGFSLAAIKETLDSWNAGRSLDHLLGIDDLLGGTGATPQDHTPLRLSPADVAERFAGMEITQQDIQRAVELGLVEVDGTDLVVSNRAFGDIGPEVGKLGVSVRELLDEYEALQNSVDEITNRFRDVFERHVWQPFVDDGMPIDNTPEITEDIGKLTELARAVVAAEMQVRFGEFAADYLERSSRVDEQRRPPSTE